MRQSRQLRIAALGLALFSPLCQAIQGAEPPSEVLIHWDGVTPLPTPVLRRRDGRALFLREVYTLRRDEDYRIARHMGFNAVIGDGERTFELAEKHGFAVTEANWRHRGLDVERWRADVAIARGRPSMLAYNLDDEPDLRFHTASPAKLAEAAAIIRAADPAARLSVTLAGSGRARSYWPDYARVVDIMRVDPYPLVSRRPLRHVKELIEAARQAAGPEKPVVAVLQAWHWPGAPFPSALQFRQMTWQALIAGSSGLSVFDWNYAVWAAHPEFWRELVAVNREIEADLGVFLAEGVRYPAREVDDVYAALWVHPQRGWRILATRLGDAKGARQVRFRLPAGVGGKRERATVALEPLASAVLGRPPASPPAAARRPYYTDAADRPLAPASAESAHPSWLQAAGLGVAFISARLAVAVRGETPVAGVMNEVGAVFSICPGGVFRQRLRLEATNARDLSAVLLSWHDTQEEVRGEELRALAHLRRVPRPPIRRRGLLATPTAERWEIVVHLPHDRDWAMGRDHLLTYELRYRLRGRRHREERTIRYRLKPAFALGWEWLAPGRGRLRATPAFAAGFYPSDLARLRLGLVAEGLAATPFGEDGALSREFGLAAGPGDGRRELLATLHLDGELLQRQRLLGLRVRGGRLLAPGQATPATARQLSSKPSFTGPWDELWGHHQGLAPFQDFLERGGQDFAPEEHTAWLAWDAEHLYWFMQCEGVGEIRAESTKADEPFLADDAMALVLEAPKQAARYVIQVNPGGVTRQARIHPDLAPGWDPALKVRTQRSDDRWRMVMAIPWREIGWPAPTAGATVRLNLAAARSIAPRRVVTWRPWGRDPAKGLAPVVLQ